MMKMAVKLMLEVAKRTNILICFIPWQQSRYIYEGCP